LTFWRFTNRIIIIIIIITSTNYTLLIFTPSKTDNQPTSFGNSTISYEKHSVHVTLSQKKAVMFQAVYWTCCRIFVTKKWIHTFLQQDLNLI